MLMWVNLPGLRRAKLAFADPENGRRLPPWPLARAESASQRWQPMLRQLIFAATVATVGIPSAVVAAHDLGADGDLIGKSLAITTNEEDTLVGIARRHDLGFVELLAANPGIDPWLPGPDTTILLPTARLLPDAPRRGIVINLAELRLYYFPASRESVVTFPVGTGKAGSETPLGKTYIVRKRERPWWVPPPSIRAEQPQLPAVVPPGPENPLGAFALDLGWPGYIIHGTNNALGVGRRVSHGCIRLYPEDIARLFARVRVGAPVAVVDQDVKLGWFEDELYLEVHPTQLQADELEAGGRFDARPIPDLDARARIAAGPEADRIDWQIVRTAASQRRGIPVRITRPARRRPGSVKTPGERPSAGTLLAQ